MQGHERAEPVQADGQLDFRCERAGEDEQRNVLFRRVEGIQGGIEEMRRGRVQGVQAFLEIENCEVKEGGG